MTGTSAPRARVERTLDASIEAVWRMWTEPDRFAQWYGPPGASIPVCEFDVRVGGRRFVAMEMPTPERTMQMWFVGEFREITEPTRLVYTESLADADGKVLSAERAGMPPGAPTETQVIAEFTDLGDGTTGLVVTHVGIPADSPGATGWQLALDKLAGRLAG